MIKKMLITTGVLLAGLCSFAQDIHLFAGGGGMNYQGDLLSWKQSYSQFHAYFTGGVYYELTDKIYLRLGAVAGKVSGDDKVGVFNKDRNLSFTSNITEVHLGAEYDIFNSYDHRLVPYLMLAAAGYHFNPYTYDATGKKIYLQPLGTEGQGFYQGRAKYKLTQLAAMFGGGIKFALNDDVYIRLEGGLRKLFSDYLDDVSTIYIDRTALLINNGQTAVDMAYRGDEVNPLKPYPAQGSVRGNAKSKDYYYTVGLAVSFRLRSNPNKGSGSKTKTGCPVNVY